LLSGRVPRRLLVLAWYPAEPAAGAIPERFWPDSAVTAPLMAADLHLPRLNPLAHLRDVPSHSYADAALASTLPRYPVLVFSHGYAGGPWQNTVQMEELASHGFIVFSIGHPGESGALLYPDGRIAVPDRTRVRTMLAGGPSAEAPLAESLAVWVDDTAQVVNRLEAIAGREVETSGPEARFAQRLDLDRLGVFGMSFGGATAVEFCLADRRCKAALDMDGLVHGAAAEDPLGVPVLYFARDGNTLNDAALGRATADRYRVEVAGTTHLDFTDVALVAPLLRYGGALGAIDGTRMMRVVNAYTLAFFDRHLRDGRWRLLFDVPSRAGYPEVMLSARRAPLKPPQEPLPAAIRLPPPRP
jgi:predicted dienelactone hydrolase